MQRTSTKPSSLPSGFRRRGSELWKSGLSWRFRGFLRTNNQSKWGYINEIHDDCESNEKQRGGSDAERRIDRRDDQIQRRLDEGRPPHRLVRTSTDVAGSA